LSTIKFFYKFLWLLSNLTKADILGLFTNFMSLTFANESVCGKFVKIIHVPTYEYIGLKIFISRERCRMR